MAADLDLRHYTLRCWKRFGDWVYYELGSTRCRRAYVVPTDPNTPAQQTCRTTFAQAVAEAKTLTAAQRAYWANTPYCRWKNVSWLNALIHYRCAGLTPPPDPRPT